MGRSPLEALAEQLQGHPQRRLIERAVVSLLEMTRFETQEDEWRGFSTAPRCPQDHRLRLGPHQPRRSLL